MGLTVAGGAWAAAYSVVAIAVELPLAWAVGLLVVGVVGIAGAEAIHAPSSMAGAAEAAPPAARGRYLAAFQYSWLAAEIGGPVLFASLFARQAWLPFALVAVANAAAAALAPRVMRALAKSRTGSR